MMVIGGDRNLGCSVGRVVDLKGGQGADRDEGVSEDAVSTPGPRARDAGEMCAVPAIASLEVVDPSFGSGSPFDLVAEGSSVLKYAAGGTGFACPWDRDAAHAESVEVAFN